MSIWLFSRFQPKQKIGHTELYEILLHIMMNGLGKQYLLQVFSLEVMTFKKAISMFEMTDIVESIYEGVL